jgi:hypothetical protein
VGICCLLFFFSYSGHLILIKKGGFFFSFFYGAWLTGLFFICFSFHEQSLSPLSTNTAGWKTLHGMNIPILMESSRVYLPLESMLPESIQDPQAAFPDLHNAASVLIPYIS